MDWVFEVVFGGRNISFTAFSPSTFVCARQWSIMKATLQSSRTNLLSSSFTNIGGFSLLALAAAIPVILTFLVVSLFCACYYNCHIAETMIQQTDCKTAGPNIEIRHLHNTKFILERFFLQGTK